MNKHPSTNLKNENILLPTTLTFHLSSYHIPSHKPKNKLLYLSLSSQLSPLKTVIQKGYPPWTHQSNPYEIIKHTKNNKKQNPNPILP